MFYLIYTIAVTGWLFDIPFWIYIIYNLKYYQILFYLLFHIFAYYIEYTPFLSILSSIFINSYKSYFRVKHLNNEFYSDKLCINIVGPHGMLLNGPISISLFSNYRNNVLFIAPILIFNPMVNILTKIITYGNAPIALRNKNVVKFLKEYKKNLTVCAGGFEEMNLYNNHMNIIYTGRWKYWIKQAIINNYDLSLTYSYNGNKDFKVIPYFYWFKKLCSKIYIPFNLCYGKFFHIPHNDFIMYDFTITMELPHIQNVTNEEVNKYYIKMLEKICEKIDYYNGQSLGSSFKIL